jgi:hypothetical protein
LEAKTVEWIIIKLDWSKLGSRSKDRDHRLTPFLDGKEIMTLNDEPTKPLVASHRRWKWRLMLMGVLLVGVCVYVALPQYPLYRANRTPGRAWSAWDAADHNIDGKLTREEMDLFGNQQPHRNVEQLLQNFDAADTNHDGTVTQTEIDAYGTDIGSKDPQYHRNER